MATSLKWKISWRLTPQELEKREEQEKQVLEIAILSSILLHIAILWLYLPKPATPVYSVGKNPYMNIRRYVPPKQRIPKKPKIEQVKKKKIVPIPDPTPDEPEVYVVSNYEPVFDPMSLDEKLVFGLPNRPPGPVGPISVSQVEIPPIQLFQLEPKYPELSKLAGIEGKVRLRITVDEKGDVSDIKLLKSMGEDMDNAAIEAVKQWKFKPAYRNNVPVAVWIDVWINFHFE